MLEQLSPLATRLYVDGTTTGLAAYLMEHGYPLCDPIGVAMSPDARHVNGVGILLPDKFMTAPRHHLRTSRDNHTARRVHLGTIWTSSHLHGATPDYWVFTVLGRGDNYSRALQLTRELREAFAFEAAIWVKLAQDEIAGEKLPCDSLSY